MTKPMADKLTRPGSGTTGGSGQIRLVQGLRAVAAVFVVFFHITVLWHDKFDHAVAPWENGNAGVDLFFVISGFIMVLSSVRLRQQSAGWRRFIVLRAVRVVPMYWLATAAKLAAIAAVPALALHTATSAWNIVASFLFIPSFDGHGDVRPVLVVGWTLSFEMGFYLVFAAALFLVIDPLVLVGPVMLALAAISIFSQPGWPAIASLADPVVLEFVLGMIVGHALIKGRVRQMSPIGALFILAAGLACLALIPTAGRWERLIVWGVAATAALLGSVIADRRAGRHLPDWIVQIGEASYSLYLSHGFVLPVVGAVLARSGLHGRASGPILAGSCLVASVLFAFGIYRYVEVPVTRHIRSLVGDGNAGRPASPKTSI